MGSKKNSQKSRKSQANQKKYKNAKKYQSKRQKSKKSKQAQRSLKPSYEKYSHKEFGQIILYALAIAVAALIIYYPAINYDIVYCDDNIFIQDYYGLNKDASNIGTVFKKTMGTSYYRPILNLSIIIDTQISLAQQFPDTNPDFVNPKKITPEVFHATNIILHVLASMFIFVALLKLRYKIFPSFLFGMFMAVHPILTPAASWISGRNDSLITIFILLSFICLLFYFERDRIQSGIAYVLHIIFFGIALFTKEIAAFFPFVCLAYVVLYDRERKVFDPKYLAVVAGQFVVGIFWFMMRSKAIEGIDNPDTIGFEALAYTYLNVPCLIGKFYLPVKMIALSSYEWFTITTGVIGIIAVLAYLFKSKKIDKGKAWFGVLWFILLLAPTLFIRIVYVGDFFDYAEHRAYLVMFGMIIFVLEVLKANKIDLRKPVPAIIMGAIIIVFAIRSYIYRDEFRNRKTYWSHMTEMYPWKSRGYLDLGKAYLVEDKLDSARMLYHRGIERNPKNKNLYIDMAASYLRDKKFKEAEEWAKKALKIDPGNTIAYYNLGKALMLQKKFQQAVQAFQYACRNRKHPEWNKDLGDALYKIGKVNQAIRAYQKVINANPRNSYAFNNMGLSFAALKNWEQAEIAWKRAINANPKMYPAYQNLMRIALRKKNINQFKAYFNAYKQNGGKGLPKDIKATMNKLNINF